MATGTEILNSKEWKTASEEERGKIFARKVAKDPDYADQPKEIQDQIYERFFPKAEAVVEEAPPAADTSNFAYPEIEGTVGSDTEAKPKGMRKDTAALAGAGIGLTIPTLLQKFRAAPDKLQREIYKKALTNSLAQAGIDVANIKGEDDLIAIARQLMPQRAFGQQEQLGRLQQQADVLRGIADIPTTTGFPSELEERLGRASGPKVEGASGASNWMRSQAGEGHQLPERILATAEDMTKANPKGGQALINQDLANLQKIRDIGAGDFRLAGTGKGQLMVPSQAAGQVESIQATRTAQEAQVAREALAIILPQISQLESEIARMTAQGQDVTNLIVKLEELRRAEGAARQITKGINIPPQAGLGSMAKLGTKARPTTKPGLAASALGHTLAGTSAGINLATALDESADPIERGLAVMGGGFDALSMAPPVGVGAPAKGIGIVGGLGTAGLQAGYSFLSPETKEKLRKQLGIPFRSAMDKQ